MLTMCLLGLGCAAAFAGTAPWLARRLPPRTAIYLLVGGAVLTTAAALSMLAFLGVTVLVQLPMVATAGDWSPSLLHATDPVPRWVAVCSLALLPAALVTGVAAAARQLAAMARLRRVCRDLGGAEGPVDALHHHAATNRAELLRAERAADGCGSKDRYDCSERGCGTRNRTCT